jgi:ACS family hexuronate transporter-like MFS transporter
LELVVWQALLEEFYFLFLVGYLLDTYKKAGDINIGYNVIFIICSMAYIIAWLAMHFLHPKWKSKIIAECGIIGFNAVNWHI